MKQLTCEMCGSTDLLKQDGVFVCQTCGMKYSVEEAKKMMIEGTVIIDRTDEIKKLITRAKIEIDNKQNKNAKNILDEALKKDPQNGEIHYLIYFCTSSFGKGNYEGDNYCDIFGNNFYIFDQIPSLRNAIRFCKKFAACIEDDIRRKLSKLKSIYIDDESVAVTQKIRTMEIDKNYLEGVNRLETCNLSIDFELSYALVQKIIEIEEKKLSPLNGFPAVSFSSEYGLADSKFVYFSRMGISRLRADSCSAFYDDGYIEFILKVAESGLGHNIYIRFSDGKEEYWSYVTSVNPVNRSEIKKAAYEFNRRAALLKGESPPKDAGCYVATCVYGSYDCPEVWTLRRYRDDTLGSTWYGRLFIRTYYAISPTLVKWFGHTRWFKRMWRGKLDRMVKRLQDSGVESTPYQDKSW